MPQRIVAKSSRLSATPPPSATDDVSNRATSRRTWRGDNLALFLVSFLTLFLEISLIRWLSTEIRIFAYVNNLVLLACFLGMGVGCYYSERPGRVSVTVLGLAILLFLVTAPLSVFVQGTRLHLVKDTPTLLSAFSDSLIWYQHGPRYLLLKSGAGMLSTLVIFSLIVVTFMPLGQLLGRLLRQHTNLIAAYSVNVLASLIGLWSFNLLSFLYQPPWVWFLVVWVGAAWLMRRERMRGWFAYGSLGGCLAMVVVLAAQMVVTRGTTLWSPYQKLEMSPYGPPHRGYTVKVNGVGYMALLDLSGHGQMSGVRGADDPSRRFNQYDLPYMFKPQPKHVLIVGAGPGNDVAGAIRNGAQQITAVEIDPGIYRIGRQLHPEDPYSNPRAEMVIDDARSFFRKAPRRYDLISFGLLDAHTLTSTLNNARIDHYVYTMESFREARDLLQDDGVLTVIFAAQREWIGDRLAGMLRHVFTQEPLAFSVPGDKGVGWGGLMLVVSKDMAQVRETLSRHPVLRDFVERHAVAPTRPVQLTTDDWPYLYLQHPRIPTLHLCLSAILLGLVAVISRVVLYGRRRIDWHFFFLGAAFLLLEFQNVSKTTLLFGSTWLVNAFTISAILVLILLANLVAATAKQLKPSLVYAGLLGSMVLMYVVPLQTFNTLSFIPKVILSGLVLNLPVLFAGIVFIRSFHRASDPGVAFGSNLLGAGVGGLLESISFVTGIHALLTCVAVLYLASWLCLAPSDR